MPITIDLPPEAESRLLARASELGEPADRVATRVLAEALEWDERDRLDALEGIKRGLEASHSGRVRSAEQVLGSMREKLDVSGL